MVIMCLGLDTCLRCIHTSGPPLPRSAAADTTKITANLTCCAGSLTTFLYDSKINLQVSYAFFKFNQVCGHWQRNQ